jgi:hypothetical protein
MHSISKQNFRPGFHLANWTTPSQVRIKRPNCDNLCFDGIINTKDEWPLYRITGLRQSIYMTVARIQDEEDKRL